MLGTPLVERRTRRFDRPRSAEDFRLQEISVESNDDLARSTERPLVGQESATWHHPHGRPYLLTDIIKGLLRRTPASSYIRARQSPGR